MLPANPILLLQVLERRYPEARYQPGIKHGCRARHSTFLQQMICAVHP